MTGRHILSTRTGMNIGHLAMCRREVFITLIPLHGGQCFEKRSETVDRIIYKLREGTVTLDTMNL